MVAKVAAVMSAKAQNAKDVPAESSPVEERELSTALFRALDTDRSGCITLTDISKFLYITNKGLPFDWKEVDTCLCELRKFGAGESENVSETIGIFAAFLQCERRDVAKEVTTLYEAGWKRQIGSLYDGGSVSCESS